MCTSYIRGRKVKAMPTAIERKTRDDSRRLKPKPSSYTPPRASENM
jgi:hypothetical protein